ncbi:MAG: lysophospholipid acyltransferase family protein [bacterium]|nr:lysophospholipid acyltransferase family protein [bacterium]
MKDLFIKLKILVLGTLGAVLLNLISSSLRWRELILTEEGIDVFDRPSKILLFWHGRQLMIPTIYWRSKSKNKNALYSLISQHTDGRIMAMAIKVLGVHSVAGSSSKGGKEASKELIQKLKDGYSIGITPDGPKGPIYKAKPGALKIAYETGVKIFPITFSSEKYWQFSSWDRMILPKPFSKAVFVVGKPIEIKQKLSDENIVGMLNELNQALNESQTLADSFQYD